MQILPLALSGTAATWLFVWFVACPLATVVVYEAKGHKLTAATVLAAVMLGGIGTFVAMFVEQRVYRKFGSEKESEDN